MTDQTKSDDALTVPKIGEEPPEQKAPQPAPGGPQSDDRTDADRNALLQESHDRRET